jgi:hypothetical protein
MISTLHVLTIGSFESNDSVRDMLLSRTKCRLFAVSTVWDLSAVLTSGDIDVAVLHDTLPAAELRSSAHYIRRHWNCARILLMSAHAELLDDALYDERLAPSAPAETLLAMIEQLAARARQRSYREFRGEHAESGSKGANRR